MGLGIDSRPALIAGVLLGGAIIGLVNTLLTEALMRVAPDIERPVASAAYGFVRFGGGALAPWLAGKLSESGDEQVPFLVAGAVVLLATVPLLAGRSLVRHVDADEAAAAAAPRPVDEPAPVLLAVDASPAARGVTAEAARVARLRDGPVHVVHVPRPTSWAVLRSSARAPRWRARRCAGASTSCAARASAPRARCWPAPARTPTCAPDRAAGRLDAGAALVVIGRGEAGAELAGAAPTNVLVVRPVRAARAAAAAA